MLLLTLSVRCLPNKATIQSILCMKDMLEPSSFKSRVTFTGTKDWN